MSFFDIARSLLKSLEVRQMVIARLLLLRKSADTVRLKIIAFSLNLLIYHPHPSPLPSREREKKVGKIFNAHPLDFFNANFYVPERYCFAARQRAII